MSSLLEFDINDTVTARSQFKVGDTLTDPTTVALSVTDPTGIVSNYTYAGTTVTKDATGMYSKALSVDKSGEWIAVWTGTGTVAASDTRRFAVRRQGA